MERELYSYYMEQKEKWKEETETQLEKGRRPSWDQEKKH